jgi:hypothetical protein
MSDLDSKSPDKKPPADKAPVSADEFIVEQTSLSAHQLLNDRRGISLTAGNILHLQRTIGNQAVQKLLVSGNRLNSNTLLRMIASRKKMYNRKRWIRKEQVLTALFYIVPVQSSIYKLW